VAQQAVALSQIVAALDSDTATSETMATSAQYDALALACSLASSSGAIGIITDTAATSVVGALSSLVSGGILNASGCESASPGVAMSTALSNMSMVHASTLVDGEDAAVVSSPQVHGSSHCFATTRTPRH
jgi:hypothetical protein